MRIQWFVVTAILAALWAVPTTGGEPPYEVEQGDTLFDTAMAERCECGPGRRHSPVHVGRTAETDAAHRLFGRRVDDIRRAFCNRVHPLAINIKLK